MWRSTVLALFHRPKYSTTSYFSSQISSFHSRPSYVFDASKRGKLRTVNSVDASALCAQVPLFVPVRCLTKRERLNPKNAFKAAVQDGVFDDKMLEPASQEELSTMPGFFKWNPIFQGLTNGADRYVSSEEWKTFYADFVKKHPRDKDIFFGIMMTLASSFKYQQFGQSIVDHFRIQNIPLNLVVAAKHIRLLGCSEAEDAEEKIIKAYDDLLKLNKIGIFAVSLAEAVIPAICRTRRWKESFRLLEMMATVGSIGPTTLNHVVAAAFNNNEPATAQDLLRKLEGGNQRIVSETSQAWFRHAKKEGIHGIKKMLEQMNMHRWFISLETARQLKDFMENQSGEKWIGKYSTVSNKGQCRACDNYLTPIVLSKEDFETLKEKFLKHVIENTDVFLRTNPKEMKAFTEFIEQRGPFDLVIDGLNAAYFQAQADCGPKRLARQLRYVLEHYAKKLGPKKKILVLGRRHMNSWPRDELRRIFSLATCFFAENISQDDPFLLYACLSSGIQCDFLSGDEMRDHSSKLVVGNDMTMQKLFLLWQRTHQVGLNKVYPDGTLSIRPPLKFDTVAQWTDSMIHVPYESGNPRSIYDLPTDWLCLKKGSQPVVMS